jgi:cytochrome d ubiquinol oxidase subunit I
MLASTFQWLRGKLAAANIAQQKWLLRGWILAAPLGYIAVETGWIVRCVGRQPWTVYGEVRTVDAASNLPAGEVLASLTGFAVLYSLLFIAALYFGSRIIRQGPNLELPIPKEAIEPSLDTSPAQHEPDRRPVEAQQ